MLREGNAEKSATQGNVTTLVDLIERCEDGTRDDVNSIYPPDSWLTVIRR
jgi:hypothetical protein